MLPPAQTGMKQQSKGQTRGAVAEVGWELHIVLLEMVCTAKCVLSVKPSPIFMISRRGASSENILMPC